MWGYSLPWHKVFNAVVAEMSIYISERIKEDVSILCYSSGSVWWALRRKTQSKRESMRPLWFFHLYIYTKNYQTTHLEQGKFQTVIEKLLNFL